MSDPQAETRAGGAREERVGRVLNDYLDRRARGAAESVEDLARTIHG